MVLLLDVSSSTEHIRNRILSNVKQRIATFFADKSRRRACDPARCGPDVASQVKVAGVLIDTFVERRDHNLHNLKPLAEITKIVRFCRAARAGA